MIQRKNLLNNMSLQNHRKNQLYCAIITDLCLEGVISREKAEAILGYEIPSSLKGPTGATLPVVQTAPKKKAEAAAPVVEKVADEEAVSDAE